MTVLSILGSSLKRARARVVAAEAWLVPGLVLLAGALIALRCWPMLLAPTLPAEDGKRIFAYFYEHRELSHLVRSKSDYVPLLPNLLGFAAVRLPVPWAPLFLTLAPALFTLLCLTWFARAEFASVVSSRRVRVFVCLALASMPVASYFFVCHTDYSIWNALFLCLLLSLVPLSLRPLGAPLGFLGRALLIWSHPLSFVALPVQGVRWLRDRGAYRRSVGALLLLVQFAHLAWGVSFGRSRAAEEGASLAGSDFWLGRLLAAAHHVGDFVVPRALLGVNRAELAAERWPALSVWLTVVTLGALALVVGLGPRLAKRTTYAALVYFVAVLSLAAVSSEVPDESATRYAYVQSLFCILLVCLALAELGARFGTRRALVSFGLCTGALLYALFLYVRDLDNYRDARAGNGARVAACMRRIRALERVHGGPCGFTLSCLKRQDWSFVVSPPDCLPR